MLNCKDMTKLISDSMDAKITLRQRMELWGHILMCGLCRRFHSNALVIRKRVRECDTPPTDKVAGAEPEEASLSAEARKRIAAAMKEQRG